MTPLYTCDPVGEVDAQDDRLHALDGEALLHHALDHQGINESNTLAALGLFKGTVS